MVMPKSVCRTTLEKNIQLLWEETDSESNVGQCFVSLKNSTCYTPVTHNTLSDGDVKVLPLVRQWSKNIQLLWEQTEFIVRQRFVFGENSAY